MCRHQQRFGHGGQSSTLIYNFKNLFSIVHFYRAGHSMNSLPSQRLARCLSGYRHTLGLVSLTHGKNAKDKIKIESLTQITIRKGLLDDLPELQQLFVDSISSICQNDYDSKQINAWISTIENQKRWQELLTNQFVLVAHHQDILVGFCSLDKGNYIDFLYVHKDYQRQGVAYKLYLEIEQEARRQRQTELASDVSKTARPFFEKVGFRVTNEQRVILKDVELSNYKMTKKL